METGMLFAGEGIGKASDGVQFFSDLKAAAVPCPFKDHMFNKVGNPVFFLCLISGTHINPYAQRNGSEMLQSFGHNPDTIF